MRAMPMDVFADMDDQPSTTAMSRCGSTYSGQFLIRIVIVGGEHGEHLRTPRQILAEFIVAKAIWEGRLNIDVIWRVPKVCKGYSYIEPKRWDLAKLPPLLRIIGITTKGVIIVANDGVKGQGGNGVGKGPNDEPTLNSNQHPDPHTRGTGSSKVAFGKRQVLSGDDVDLAKRNDIGESRRKNFPPPLAGAGTKSKDDVGHEVDNIEANGNLGTGNGDTGDSDDEYCKQVEQQRASRTSAGSSSPEPVDGNHQITYEMENSGSVQGRDGGETPNIDPTPHIGRTRSTTADGLPFSQASNSVEGQEASSSGHNGGSGAGGGGGTKSKDDVGHEVDNIEANGNLGTGNGDTGDSDDEYCKQVEQQRASRTSAGSSSPEPVDGNHQITYEMENSGSVQGRDGGETPDIDPTPHIGRTRSTTADGLPFSQASNSVEGQEASSSGHNGGSGAGGGGGTKSKDDVGHEVDNIEANGNLGTGNGDTGDSDDEYCKQVEQQRASRTSAGSSSPEPVDGNHQITYEMENSGSVQGRDGGETPDIDPTPHIGRTRSTTADGLPFSQASNSVEGQEASSSGHNGGSGAGGGGDESDRSTGSGGTDTNEGKSRRMGGDEHDEDDRDEGNDEDRRRVGELDGGNRIRVSNLSKNLVAIFTATAVQSTSAIITLSLDGLSPLAKKLFTGVLVTNLVGFLCLYVALFPSRYISQRAAEILVRVGGAAAAIGFLLMMGIKLSLAVIVPACVVVLAASVLSFMP